MVALREPFDHIGQRWNLAAIFLADGNRAG
jgi:hypothetical protein